MLPTNEIAWETENVVTLKMMTRKSDFSILSLNILLIVVIGLLFFGNMTLTYFIIIR